MAFQGGPLNTIGITPQFLNTLAQQTAATGTTQALGQVWKGSGQSFFGSAGQALAGNLASSAVNIALNSAFATNVVGPSGVSLTSGSNVLASTITPYVTGAISAGINQQIQQSLQAAGPFGSVIAPLATGLATQLFGGIAGSVLGGAAGGNVTNYKSFPGGGGEPSSDYGGKAYTLTDVVFSLQPANQGPQAFGLNQGISLPKSITTLPFNSLTSMPLLAGNQTANTLKRSAMVNGLVTKPVSVSNFTTRTLF